MGFYNDITLSRTAEDARYDRIDYGYGYGFGNSTTGADQGLDIDPDANEGSGDLLVDQAYQLSATLYDMLTSATQRGYAPETALMRRVYQMAERRYWRRLATLQPRPQVEYAFVTDDDLPF